MTEHDVSDTIQAKSDQLNADDLVAGPITVTVQRVRRGEPDQPVVIEINQGRQPWKPCKSMRRVLVAAWGADARVWVGRSIRLYRDPAVRWAGKPVGGIRVQALSHITEPLTLALAVTRGKKADVRVCVLETAAPPPTLDELLTDAELTVNELDRWLESIGKPSTAAMDPTSLAGLATWLAADLARLDPIRDLAAAADQTPAEGTSDGPAAF